MTTPEKLGALNTEEALSALEGVLMCAFAAAINDRRSFAEVHAAERAVYHLERARDRLRELDKAERYEAAVASPEART